MSFSIYSLAIIVQFAIRRLISRPIQNGGRNVTMTIKWFWVMSITGHGTIKYHMIKISSHFVGQKKSKINIVSLIIHYTIQLMESKELLVNIDMES